MPKITIDLDTKSWRSLVELASAEGRDLHQQAVMLLTQALHNAHNKRRQQAQAALAAHTPRREGTETE
jgi:hypothetical protein